MSRFEARLAGRDIALARKHRRPGRAWPLPGPIDLTALWCMHHAGQTISLVAWGGLLGYAPSIVSAAFSEWLMTGAGAFALAGLVQPWVWGSAGWTFRPRYARPAPKSAG